MTFEDEFIPECVYNFSLLYCWITGRAKNVKVKKIVRKSDRKNEDSKN
jgi:hypothetical protein